jgi:hypothetical protein
MLDSDNTKQVLPRSLREEYLRLLRMVLLLVALLEPSLLVRLQLPLIIARKLPLVAADRVFTLIGFA